jgi:hypothetical protein
MRRRANEATTHNLDINSYSIEELYELFKIPPYDISPEQIKNAKKQVLMTHPDKSNLDADYFLFYKKAYDCLIRFYTEQHKITADTTESVSKLRSQYDDSVKPDNHSDYISNKINKMDKKEFSQTFNTIFEKEMSTKPDPTVNSWFVEKKQMYDESLCKTTEAGINQSMEKIRKNAGNVTVYRGVQPLVSSTSTATGGLYNEDEDKTVYVTSDPFSKLKYDDLRKVHKDQTVLAVGEEDFSNVKQYKDVKEYSNSRNRQEFNYIDKEQSLKILEDNERAYKEAILKKQFESDKRTATYESKNSAVMSSFLRIT